jgi:hypothetical protein
MFGAFLLAASLAAGPGAPALDRIEDLKVRRAEGAIEVIIALDTQPAGATSGAAPGGISVTLEGVDLAFASIAPPADRGLDRIVVVPGQGGARILLEGPLMAGASAAETLIYRHAVVVRIVPATPAPQAALGLDRVVIPPVAATDLEASVAPAPEPDLEKARCDAADATLQSDPWAMEALADHGACRLQAGDLEAATSAFRRVLAFDPENVRARAGMEAVDLRRKR